MMHRTLQISILSYASLAGLLVVSTSLAGAPPGTSTEGKKDQTKRGAEKGDNEKIRREAEQVIRGIDLEILRDDKWTKVERIEKPLLFYSDPARRDDRGSVWGWGTKGRPLALIEFYRGATNREGWTFAICNTSGSKLRAHRKSALWWEENDSAAERKDIPGAAAPAADSPVRLRQMKLLAEKFTAHEFFNPGNTRYELRLLKRPLYTYRDEDSGLLEGGVFTLAHGTNPEIMLFIEARVDPKDKSKRVWQFTVGRSSNAEWNLEHNGKEVIHAPPLHGVFASDKPYYFGYINDALDAEPRKP